MLEILQIVLPVFIVVAAGYLAVLKGGFNPEFADGLMKFAQSFAIPCLLFTGISNLDLAAMYRPEILMSFYAGSGCCFLLGTLSARSMFKRSPGEAVSVGFSALFANSVLLGIPILQLAYGDTSLQIAFVIVSIHAPFCYLLGITTMELSRANGRSLGASLLSVARSVGTNPLTIGLVLGFTVNLSGIALPVVLTTAIDLMVRAALPAALFGLGGILVRYSLSERLGEVAMVSGLRLLLHPLIAFVLSDKVFGLDDAVVKTIVIVAAMPPGINSYVFANMYDRAKGSAAATILISTTASILTISIWLWILA